MVMAQQLHLMMVCNVEKVHQLMYIMRYDVNRKQLEKELTRLGWWKARDGGSYSILTNGVAKEAVPRHREVNEWLALKIIRKAKLFPQKEL